MPVLPKCWDAEDGRSYSEHLRYSALRVLLGAREQIWGRESEREAPKNAEWTWRNGSGIGGAYSLPEDLSSVPSAHMAVHNHLSLQLHGIQLPLLASADTRTHVHKPTHKHMQLKMRLKINILTTYNSIPGSPDLFQSTYTCTLLFNFQKCFLKRMENDSYPTRY